MRLERDTITRQNNHGVILNEHGMPEINIVSINHLRTDLDGEKKEWADHLAKRPKTAPVKVLMAPHELFNVVKSNCRSDKKTGVLRLNEILAIR